jgi:RNA polymerase-binding transcription factor DksA
MSNIVMHRQATLTGTQVQEIRAELARESQRLAPDDPRADAFAAALQRIERGTYGDCATCGDRIPHDRLSVVPETLYCVSCRIDNS